MLQQSDYCICEDELCENQRVFNSFNDSELAPHERHRTTRLELLKKKIKED
jgi:hypothetical protein